MSAPTLAVDLGGTNMRAGIVNASGEVMERMTEPTPQGAACADALIDLAGGVLEGDQVSSAVIGVPGRVDYASGAIEYAPNLPDAWDDELAEGHLTDALGLPVHLANDADLAAVGEAYAGAGRNHEDVAYMTVSTGIGAGVLLGRRLAAGRRSLAEIGHTVVDIGPAGRSTLEELGSGTALERMAQQAGLTPDGRRVVELVEAGDESAQLIWDRLMSVVAAGVRNLAFSFSPELVIIGGGVGLNGELVLGPVREHLAGLSEFGGLPEIEVANAELGDDAALAGAAFWETAAL